MLKISGLSRDGMTCQFALACFSLVWWQFVPPRLLWPNITSERP